MNKYPPAMRVDIYYTMITAVRNRDADFKK